VNWISLAVALAASDCGYHIDGSYGGQRVQSAAPAAGEGEGGDADRAAGGAGVVFPVIPAWA
jgi:hypothetical protein